jgi:hypothetical protein
LILISETWNLDKKSPHIRQHELAASTTPPSRDVGHSNGGLIILASPQAKLCSHVLQTGLNHVLFRYKKDVILFMYLPPSMEDSSIKLMLDSIPQMPTIVIGDFNIRMGASNRDTKRGPNGRISLISKACSSWNLSWLINSNNACMISRVDHIYSSSSSISHWTFHESEIKSDHGYMKVYLNQTQVESLNTSEPTRYNIRKLNDPIICEELCDLYDTLPDPFFLNGIEKVSRELATMQCLESKQTIMDNLYDDLANKIAIVASSILGEYSINRMKTQKDTMHANQINCSTRNAIMMFKRACRGSTVRLTTNDTTNNVFSVATAHYESIWSCASTDDSGSLNDEELTAFGEDWSFINKSSVSGKILKYSSTKSCGADGIHIKILKALCKSLFVRDLTSLYGLCFEHAMTPSAWNAALTVLLSKKTDDPEVTNTRPISLTLVLRRIFESLLHTQWSSCTWAALSHCQAGSRRGFSCLTQSLVNDHLSKTNGASHTVLLDLTKAFDSVRHCDILAKLRSRKVPPGAIKLIHNLFMRNMSTQLIVNHVELPPIKLSNGIFQGSVLSPFLFEIWIDDLLQDLNPTLNDFNCLGYVDDLALKAKSNTDMQRLLNACERWSLRNKAQFSTTKSISLKSPNAVTRYMYGQPLVEKDTHKYLGVETNFKGICWDLFLKSRIQKSQKMLNFCAIKGPAWNPGIRLQIVKTFVQPQLDFMAPAMHFIEAKTMEPFKKDLLDFFKSSLMWIFSSGSCLAQDTLQSMTMLRNPSDRWRELADLFCYTSQRICSNNPIRTMLKSYGKGPWPSNRLIPRLFFKSRTLLLYEHEKNTTLPPKQPESFKTFLHKKFIREREVKILPRSITMTARKIGSYIDSALFIRDDDLRTKALDWRTNRLFQRKTCKACKTAFRRSHIEKCKLLTLPHIPKESDFILKGLEETFKNKIRLSRMDLAVNAQDPILLKDCFNALERQLL